MYSDCGNAVSAAELFACTSTNYSNERAVLSKSWGRGDDFELTLVGWTTDTDIKLRLAFGGGPGVLLIDSDASGDLG